MPCTPINIGSARAIVCTRGRRPRCLCGAVPTLQCDAPGQRRSGTCDRHICATCATEVGADRHLCPVHKDLAAMLISGASDVGAENQQAVCDPVQVGLF